MPELSYVHGASDKPLLGEPIFHNLRRTAARVGDNEALVVPHQSYRATYRELVAQFEEIAPGLMARGVKMGERSGIGAPILDTAGLAHLYPSPAGPLNHIIDPSSCTSHRTHPSHT